MPQTVHVIRADSVYMGTGMRFINKHVFFSDGTSNTVIGGTMVSFLSLSFDRSEAKLMGTCCRLTFWHSVTENIHETF